MDHGGKKKSTKACCCQITAKLNEYIEASYNITFAKMIKKADESGNINCLEAAIMRFFCDVKMNDPENLGEIMPPKHNTIDGYRSLNACKSAKVLKNNTKASMTPQYFNRL